MQRYGGGKTKPPERIPAAHQGGHADDLAVSRAFTNIHDNTKMQVPGIIADDGFAIVAVQERKGTDQA